MTTKPGRRTGDTCAVSGVDTAKDPSNDLGSTRRGPGNKWRTPLTKKKYPRYAAWVSSATMSTRGDHRTAAAAQVLSAQCSVCLFYWASLPRGKEHEQDSGPMRGAPPYPTQTRKTRKIDHNTGNYVPYSFR